MKRAVSGGENREMKAGHGLLFLTIFLLLGALFGEISGQSWGADLGNSLGLYLQNAGDAGALLLGETPSLTRLLLCTLPFPLLCYLLKRGGLFWLLPPLFFLRGTTWGLLIGLLTKALPQGGWGLSLGLLGGNIFLGSLAMLSFVLVESPPLKAEKSPYRGGRKRLERGEKAPNYALWGFAFLGMLLLWEGGVLPWILGIRS